MRLIEAHSMLRASGLAAFGTNDAAALLHIEGSHATHVLSRLARTGHVVRLARGRWAFPDRLEPFALPEALTAPMPSYVSLYSALHHHGMIDQIPHAVWAITLAATKNVRTPLGAVSLHQVAPTFFFGFEQAPGGPKIAVPEKALLDFCYLRPARSRRFRALPELSLPRSFSLRRARGMASRIGSRSRRTLVLRELDRLVRASNVE